MYNEVEYKKWNKRYKKFQKDNKQSITKMVLDFNRKKSANIAKKIRKKDTGILNENKLHTYKWNEKIFKSRKIVPEGKNHGIVMLVDCSGSMQDDGKFQSAIKQCLILVDFCRRVGIKYKVMGFSDKYSKRDLFDGDIYKNSYNHKRFLRFNQIPILREWFCHEQSIREHDFMATYMLYKSKNYRAGFVSDGPNSSTPLIDSILLLRQIAIKFKEKENIDILNTITMTDGASNDTSLVTSESFSIYKSSSYDPLTKSVYRTNNCNRVQSILKFYKKVVGGNIIGFNITNSYYHNEPVFIKEGYDGYDHHYTFSFTNLYNGVSKSILRGKEQSKSVEELTDKFKDLNVSKGNEKILLSKFIDIIS